MPRLSLRLVHLHRMHHVVLKHMRILQILVSHPLRAPVSAFKSIWLCCVTHSLRRMIILSLRLRRASMAFEHTWHLEHLDTSQTRKCFGSCGVGAIFRSLDRHALAFSVLKFWMLTNAVLRVEIVLAHGFSLFRGIGCAYSSYSLGIRNNIQFLRIIFSFLPS